MIHLNHKMLHALIQYVVLNSGGLLIQVQSNNASIFNKLKQSFNFV